MTHFHSSPNAGSGMREKIKKIICIKISYQISYQISP